MVDMAQASYAGAVPVKYRNSAGPAGTRGSPPPGPVNPTDSPATEWSSKKALDYHRMASSLQPGVEFATGCVQVADPAAPCTALPFDDRVSRMIVDGFEVVRFDAVARDALARRQTGRHITHQVFDELGIVIG